MPRALRVFIKGGLDPVYNPFAPGEDVFAGPAEEVELVGLVRGLEKPDAALAEPTSG